MADFAEAFGLPAGLLPSHATPDACLRPSTLFAWEGVLGCNRPISEVATRVLEAGLLSLAALGVLDILFARHTKARYFFLHVVANLWISLLCLPDVWWILTDPLAALASHQAIHWPTSIVFSVHIYHGVRAAAEPRRAAPRGRSACLLYTSPSPRD